MFSAGQVPPAGRSSAGRVIPPSEVPPESAQCSSDENPDIPGAVRFVLSRVIPASDTTFGISRGVASGVGNLFTSFFRDRLVPEMKEDRYYAREDAIESLTRAMEIISMQHSGFAPQAVAGMLESSAAIAYGGGELELATLGLVLSGTVYLSMHSENSRENAEDAFRAAANIAREVRVAARKKEFGSTPQTIERRDRALEDRIQILAETTRSRVLLDRLVERGALSERELLEFYSGVSDFVDSFEYYMPFSPDLLSLSLAQDLAEGLFGTKSLSSDNKRLSDVFLRLSQLLQSEKIISYLQRMVIEKKDPVLAEEAALLVLKIEGLSLRALESLDVKEASKRIGVVMDTMRLALRRRNTEGWAGEEFFRRSVAISERELGKKSVSQSPDWSYNATRYILASMLYQLADRLGPENAESVSLIQRADQNVLNIGADSYAQLYPSGPRSDGYVKFVTDLALRTENTDFIRDTVSILSADKGQEYLRRFLRGLFEGFSSKIWSLNLGVEADGQRVRLAGLLDGVLLGLDSFAKDSSFPDDATYYTNARGRHSRSVALCTALGQLSVENREKLSHNPSELDTWGMRNALADALTSARERMRAGGLDAEVCDTLIVELGARLSDAPRGEGEGIDFRRLVLGFDGPVGSGPRRAELNRQLFRLLGRWAARRAVDVRRAEGRGGIRPEMRGR